MPVEAVNTIFAVSRETVGKEAGAEAGAQGSLHGGDLVVVRGTEAVWRLNDGAGLGD